MHVRCVGGLRPTKRFVARRSAREADAPTRARRMRWSHGPEVTCCSSTQRRSPRRPWRAWRSRSDGWAASRPGAASVCPAGPHGRSAAERAAPPTRTMSRRDASRTRAEGACPCIPSRSNWAAPPSRPTCRSWRGGTCRDGVCVAKLPSVPGATARSPLPRHGLRTEGDRPHHPGRNRACGPGAPRCGRPKRSPDAIRRVREAGPGEAAAVSGREAPGAGDPRPTEAAPPPAHLRRRRASSRAPRHGYAGARAGLARRRRGSRGASPPTGVDQPRSPNGSTSSMPGTPIRWIRRAACPSPSSYRSSSPSCRQSRYASAAERTRIG